MSGVSHISKTYQMGSDTVHALDDVTFHIANQEFTAVIGPSGSGKSTLMHILGCLDVADHGTYYLDGEDISDLNDDRLAEIRNRKIGFIFQQFNLLQKLNALENVELPLIYQCLHRHDRLERARQALEQVGLADRMNHRPSQLSGGQQQRVAIARALASRPSLILADEPTGNLDSHASHDILALLHDLHTAGNTILMITHDPHIAREADRCISLMDGRIIEDHRKAAES